MASSDVTRDPMWPSQEAIERGVQAYRRENGDVRGSHGRGIGAAIMADRHALADQVGRSWPLIGEGSYAEGSRDAFAQVAHWLRTGAEADT